MNENARAPTHCTTPSQSASDIQESYAMATEAFFNSIILQKTRREGGAKGQNYFTSSIPYPSCTTRSYCLPIGFDLLEEAFRILQEGRHGRHPIERKEATPPPPPYLRPSSSVLPKGSYTVKHYAVGMDGRSPMTSQMEGAIYSCMEGGKEKQPFEVAREMSSFGTKRGGGKSYHSHSSTSSEEEESVVVSPPARTLSSVYPPNIFKHVDFQNQDGVHSQRQEEEVKPWMSEIDLQFRNLEEDIKGCESLKDLNLNGPLARDKPLENNFMISSWMKPKELTSHHRILNTEQSLLNNVGNIYQRKKNVKKRGIKRRKSWTSSESSDDEEDFENEEMWNETEESSQTSTSPSLSPSPPRRITRNCSKLTLCVPAGVRRSPRNRGSSVPSPSPAPLLQTHSSSSTHSPSGRRGLRSSKSASPQCQALESKSDSSLPRRQGKSRGSKSPSPLSSSRRPPSQGNSRKSNTPRLEEPLPPFKFNVHYTPDQFALYDWRRLIQENNCEWCEEGEEIPQTVEQVMKKELSQKDGNILRKECNFAQHFISTCYECKADGRAEFYYMYNAFKTFRLKLGPPLILLCYCRFLHHIKITFPNQLEQENMEIGGKKFIFFTGIKMIKLRHKNIHYHPLMKKEEEKEEKVAQAAAS